MQTTQNRNQKHPPAKVSTQLVTGKGDNLRGTALIHNFVTWRGRCHVCLWLTKLSGSALGCFTVSRSIVFTNVSAIKNGGLATPLFTWDSATPLFRWDSATPLFTWDSAKPLFTWDSAKPLFKTSLWAVP